MKQTAEQSQEQTLTTAVLDCYELLAWIIPQLDRMPRQRRLLRVSAYFLAFLCVQKSLSSAGEKPRVKHLGISRFETAQQMQVGRHA